MADRPEEEESRSPEADEAPAAEPAGAPSGGPSIDEQVEQAIGRLAASGKLFGSNEERDEAPSPQQAPSPSVAQGFDLEGAVSRVLERREQQRRSSEEQSSLQQKISRLEQLAEKQTRKGWRKWLEPMSPWTWD